MGTFTMTCADSSVTWTVDGPVPEKIFAVAWIEMGPPGADEYNADEDILIAKLIDGPNHDGVVGLGDLVITHQYPKDFDVGATGSFGVTQHSVVEIVGLGSGCAVRAEGFAEFEWEDWTSGHDQEAYRENPRSSSALEIVDHHFFDTDLITISANAPSQPEDVVDQSRPDEASDDRFINGWQFCLEGR